MSQALHTSSTGINAGQQQINVIAHNVANINTVAFKSANMTFETLYSRNLSMGSAATKDGGGTNPKQIGYGTMVGAITRNFVPGTFVNTGRDTDCMISGNGFFVVQDANGKQFYTRDGVFSTDSDGNLVTENGMKVVATNQLYSNSSNSDTVKLPTTLTKNVYGDDNLGAKHVSELNNAKISAGDIVVIKPDGSKCTISMPTATAGQPYDPTVKTICDTLTAQLNEKGVTGGYEVQADGTIKCTANITYESATTNFLAQTGLSRSSVSEVLNYKVKLQDMASYSDSSSISLNSVGIDEHGIMIATYSDGSVLTQFVDDTDSIQWKYTTPEGVVIKGADVQTVGSVFNDTNFVIELATMVNQEGLVAINNNLWQWGADVGEVYYGMAGEMSFGSIETGGYEGSNVDIAFELSNMISAQRMIQMNSRVFSTASSMMETLAYLGQ